METVSCDQSLIVDSHFISQPGGTVDTAIHVIDAESSNVVAHSGVEGSAVIRLTPAADLKYHKVISPHVEGVQSLKSQSGSKFSDCDTLKALLSVDFQDLIQGDKFQFGYIQPGHGTKGCQMSIERAKDIEAMYEVYKGKKQVLIWIKVLKMKRQITDTQSLDGEENHAKKQCTSSGTENSAGSNYQGQLKILSEVQVIVDELGKKHNEASPPSKPFFKKAGKKKEPDITSSSLSLGKRIHYCSECIDQLDKWHSLFEKGVITTAQFAELQSTIMDNIKKF
uniref:Uncharacterized protein n=1 Tax=Amphimedon queenslandica TaxID=400682 RepID=A0A1X7VUW7_AMPQE